MQRNTRRVHPLLLNTAHHHTHASDGHPIGNFDMSVNHASATNNTVLANACTAGDYCTTRQRTTISDVHVVSDLQLIIDDHVIFNHRIIQRAAVDGGASTNLNAITNTHRAKLRNFNPLATLIRIAKAISTNHGSRLNQTI
ncbi:Uncharacterised protein [Vibrio cholerae]|nr:Uncharacterised protein [Vibrio cholerae]